MPGNVHYLKNISKMFTYQCTLPENKQDVYLSMLGNVHYLKNINKKICTYKHMEGTLHEDKQQDFFTLILER
jgi:hypothetical protein